jgi:hypothetical protein
MLDNKRVPRYLDKNEICPNINSFLNNKFVQTVNFSELTEERINELTEAQVFYS